MVNSEYEGKLPTTKPYQTPNENLPWTERKRFTELFSGLYSDSGDSKYYFKIMKTISNNKQHYQSRLNKMRCDRLCSKLKNK